MSTITERISSVGLVAVLIVDDASQAVPLAKALLAGGIGVMELTLRTPAALEALAAVKKNVPDMLAGVGTVLTCDQLDAIQKIGADFAVAPGMNPRVVSHANTLGIPFAPGVCTPSDIEQAVELGCTLLKFFPAEHSGGMNYLKTVAAPYAHLGLKYIPLGGVNTKNLHEYVSSSLVAAVGGTWIAPREIIAAGDWNTVTRNATEASRLIQSIRTTGK